MAEQRALEEAEYRRRIDICDRLMEIALRNDKALQDQRRPQRAGLGGLQPRRPDQRSRNQPR
jgi:hypothetical protein